MAIFNSYVSLPEGTYIIDPMKHQKNVAEAHGALAL